MFDDVAVDKEGKTSEVDAIVEDEEVETKTATSEAPTFADAVNDAVKDLVEQEDGSFALPEDGDYSPEMRYAVVSEKRRRDLQSTLGKSQHAKKTTDLENKALKEKLKGKVELKLTPEQATELNELKFSDPDAWREEMNKLESSASQEFNTELAEVNTEVTQESELERRQEVLDEFNASLSEDEQITQDVVSNDVPPRITNKLEAGEITFEEFLAEVKTYTSKGKVIQNEELGTKQPDLSKSGGTSSANDATVEADIVESYKTELF